MQRGLFDICDRQPYCGAQSQDFQCYINMPSELRLEKEDSDNDLPITKYFMLLSVASVLASEVIAVAKAAYLQWLNKCIHGLLRYGTVWEVVDTSHAPIKSKKKIIM